MKKNRSYSQKTIINHALLVGFVFLFGVHAQGQTTPNNSHKFVPVILIHGIGGSDLRQKPTKGIWDDGGFPNDVLKSIAGDPQKLQFDETGNPRTDNDFSKNIIAKEFYDVPGSRNITDLSKFLKKNGYQLDVTLFEFPYDFRFSVTDTAEKLSDFVENVKEKTNAERVDIVGHSMGGLVAKAYLAESEKAKNVRALIFVGTPQLGAPKALKALRYGDNLDVAIIDGCKLKRVAHNMPSMFNLLPGKKYFEAAGGGYFYDDDDLDGDSVRGLLGFEQTLYNLQNGKETKCRMRPQIDIAPLDKLSPRLIEQYSVKFHEALDDWAKPATVKVFNIVGYGRRTIKALRESGGKVTADYTTEGDGTIPLWSAESVLADAVYYVNLAKLDSDHSQMIGDETIARQIFELLAKGAGVYIAETTASRPGNTRFNIRTRQVKIKEN